MSERYACIVADPPWLYRAGDAGHGAASGQYETMTIGDLCALPVAEVAAPYARCFTCRAVLPLRHCGHCGEWICHTCQTSDRHERHYAAWAARTGRAALAGIEF